MTNPFTQLSTGGAWIKPADHNNHLVIIANVRPLGRKYDDMRKAEVDVATFDFADLMGTDGWQTGVQNSHAGWTNKLTGIAGNPEGKALARVGQVPTTNGYQAWVLADPSAEDVTAAIAWLNANPAPAAAPAPFAGLTVAPAPVAAPVVAAPAAAGGDVAALLAQLQAAQAAAS